MKKSIRIVGIAALSIFAASVFGSAAEAKEQKIGYVNMSLVFDSYEKTKKFDKDLEMKAEAKRKERETIVNQVKKLRDELDLLSEDKKTAKQPAVDEKVRELQAFDKDARETLRTQRDTMLKEILQEIDVVIKDVGQKEGYSFILHDRVLLYKDESTDLSQKIIQKLNAGK